jgi:hypothetical protein
VLPPTPGGILESEFVLPTLPGGILRRLYAGEDGGGKSFLVTATSISGASATETGNLETKCTENSNIITLTQSGALQRSFLKNEGRRTAMNESELWGTFDVHCTVTCPVTDFHIRAGSDTYDLTPYYDYYYVYYYYDIETLQAVENGYNVYDYTDGNMLIDTLDYYDRTNILPVDYTSDQDEYTMFDIANRDTLGDIEIQTDIPASYDIAYIEHIFIIVAEAKGGAYQNKQVNFTIDICKYEEMSLTFGDNHNLNFSLDIINNGVRDDTVNIIPEFSSNDSYCHPVQYKLFTSTNES